VLDAPARNWVISDSATPLTAGAGCTQSTADEVRCARAGARPIAYLGGGDDTFAAPDDGGWIVYGEAGSDRLTGGAGEDLITYTAATGPVTVDLGTGTGSQAGEHDVLTGIQDASASGTLIGDDGRNLLTGTGRDDVISGDGNDIVNGGGHRDPAATDGLTGDGPIGSTATPPSTSKASTAAPATTRWSVTTATTSCMATRATTPCGDSAAPTRSTGEPGSTCSTASAARTG
jgi:Ca2+-binding RTX toxin-like protein